MPYSQVRESFARKVQIGSVVLGMSAFTFFSAITLAAESSNKPFDSEKAMRESSSSFLESKRPILVKTPGAYDPKGPALPLVILLHGYGSSPESQDQYLKFSEAALKRGFIFAAPSGTPTPSLLDKFPNGPSLEWKLFWNATEACCNFENVQDLDDVAYLKNLIREMGEKYAVDLQRVYIFGHSNGGFMALRMACDGADAVTAIASLAGSLRPDPESCKPSQPVSVLSIHGVKDDVVLYRGGQFNESDPLSRYPSAQATTAKWGELNGCKSVKNPEARDLSLQLLDGSQGPDTARVTYESCAPGGATELLSIPEGSHAPGANNSPGFNSDFLSYVFDFFLSQKRSEPARR